MSRKHNLQGVKEHGKINVNLPEVIDQFQRKEISRRDFMSMASALGMSAAAVYGFAGGTTPTAHAAVKGGTFRMESPLQELKDPQNFSWIEGSNVTRGICEYLTSYGHDAVVKPYLAESWKISGDGKIVDFFLRKGIKWSNGDEFNADDVVHNFMRWRVDGNKSPNNGEWGTASVLADVEKVNSHQVRLHLTQPDVSVAHRLFAYPTQIVHHSFDDSGADLTKESIGTGPFKLDEYRVDESAKISRREGYWGSPDGLGDAYLDGVHFISLGNDDQAKISALKSDQIDWIYKIVPKQLPIVQGMSNTTILETVTAQTPVMRFNVKGVDPKIREAIILAAGNAEMLKIAYSGLGLEAENHHTSPGQPDYYDLGSRPKQDFAKAKALWEAAGMAGKEFKITLGNTQGTWEQDTAQVLQQQCRKADIDLQLEILPTGQYWDVWDKSDFGLTFWTDRPLAVMLHSLAYKSGVPWNEARFSNKKYDAALSSAVGSPDAKAASEYMKVCEEELQNNHVMVQPFWVRLSTGGNSKVHDFPRHAAEFYPLHRVWMDA